MSTKRQARKLIAIQRREQRAQQGARLWALLNRHPLGKSVAAVASDLGLSITDVPSLATQLSASGKRVVLIDGLWLVADPYGDAQQDVKLFTRVSDEKGLHRFGVISDTHEGSKYARRDVVHTMFDRFEAAGITEVYHCGNWIEGEARFNKFDLLPEAHGLQAQLDLFVKTWPRKKSITTRFVTGDDHEGWYAQREGVNPGELLEQTARKAGRKDLEHLGYKEAFVSLIHKRTRKTSTLLVDHPGGGSAYADSYAAQKRVEAVQSGEKPGMWLFGHWHKLGYFVPRGVHVVLAGCCKDLDPFGRKKGLRYDVGGTIIEAWQDPQGGLGRVRADISYFFDRDYYNFQFDPARPLRKRRAPSVVPKSTRAPS